jgi:8-oxo-dGTP diphosphatase
MSHKIIFGNKLENTEYRERIAVYGVAKNDEDEMAVIKTPGGYFLPGGGVENSETHKECLKREFIEETGYDIEIGEYIGNASLYHISKTGQYMYGDGHFYFVKLKCKITEAIEEDHKMMWMEPYECMKNLRLEHQAWAISKVLNGSK